MKRLYATGLACGLVAAGAGVAAEVTFEKPVRLTAGGELIKVEAPGYAAPCLADVDGDGVKDLLVGQFRDGKIMVYPGKGKGRFDKGDWLKVGGEVAKVPGVW